MTIRDIIPEEVMYGIADIFGITVEQVEAEPLCHLCADLFGVRTPGHVAKCGCCEDCFPEDVLVCDEHDEWVRQRFTCPFHGDCC